MKDEKEISSAGNISVLCTLGIAFTNQCYRYHAALPHRDTRKFSKYCVLNERRIPAKTMKNLSGNYQMVRGAEHRLIFVEKKQCRKYRGAEHRNTDR
ncbi:MAG: hypothetical protein MUE74_00480 [Bacteroidales bacterium]|jgi:hypothetical protein|nr:hypothetical protein [Bacteroidales bacterium]